MDWSGITAVIAVLVAVGTLLREWVRDRAAGDQSARADAAAWYERWQEAEQRRSETAESFRLREAEWLADMVTREQRWAERLESLAHREAEWEAKCVALANRIARLESVLRTQGIDPPNGGH